MTSLKKDMHMHPPSTTNNAISLLPHSSSPFHSFATSLSLCATPCMGLIFVLCVIFRHFAFSHADYYWLPDSWLVNVYFCRTIKPFFDLVSSLSFLVLIFLILLGDIKSELTKYAISLHSKDTPSPHHSHTLSFPPPQFFPIGVLKAWSACVAALVCALLAASLVLSFLGFSKGDCSYKTH